MPVLVGLGVEPIGVYNKYFLTLTQNNFSFMGVRTTVFTIESNSGKISIVLSTQDK